jgi:phage terminase large subunit
MHLNFNTTCHFKQLNESNKKISVFQGGARSGKTYNILQWFILKMLTKQNKIFTICRESMPALRSSAMRDFFNILKEKKIYNQSYHNKTHNEYHLNNNIVEFVSLDDEQKVRGRKRDYLFINEANECKYDIWIQLALRTIKKSVLDYNPSDLYHFIYDEIIPREDCDFYKSTYKDNVYLEDSVVKEIEGLKESNENLWRIYGQGERGLSQETIYTNWKEISVMPKDHEFQQIVYGVDFGFNHPSAIVKVGIIENNAYLEEVLYETRLTNQNLIDKLKINVDNEKEIYADSAEPDRIKEISDSGFNIYPVVKSGNSVNTGIDKVKNYKLHILSKSSNIKKEIKNYSWKKDKKTNQILDEPVKFKDHSMDAIRYAVMSVTSENQNFWERKA